MIDSLPVWAPFASAAVVFGGWGLHRACARWHRLFP